jgi:hypothetical protein
MSSLVPLNNLVSALRAATSGKKSGAFFITTESQHSAMITLSEGTITGLKYRQARGYDAASALAQIAQLKYQTAAEPTELPGESDLNTRAILEILATGSAESGGAAAASFASSIDLDALREQYVSAIGPIGGALFDEVVDDLGDQLGTPDGARKLIEQLAEQIDDEAEAKKFRQAAGS